MEGKLLKIESPERISISALVSVEYSDAMFLGEVVGCHRSSGGIFELDIKVDQILTGLQSLMTLRAQLVGETMPMNARSFAPAFGNTMN